MQPMWVCNSGRPFEDTYENPGHSGEKSNKCNQCNFASSYASVLSDHMKRHSGKKSNKCNQCDFASYYASALRVHLKRHSGEKSKKCNQCDYASFDGSNLRAHLKMHTGEQLAAPLFTMERVDTMDTPEWMIMGGTSRLETSPMPLPNTSSRSIQRQLRWRFKLPSNLRFWEHLKNLWSAR